LHKLLKLFYESFDKLLTYAKNFVNT